jgi:hypothetical protein
MILLFPLILFILAACMVYVQEKGDTASVIGIACLVFSAILLFSKEMQ